MQAEKLERISVPALDVILGKEFKVLDDGFVRLIDYMGDDGAIVQAARVSYGAGTKKLSEDEGLIRYLMRHRHTTPFEMCELKLHVRAPMDCWRQWIRHRTANVNEYSTRYSDAIDRCQRTEPDAWRLQGKGNKQGSSGFLGQSESMLLSVREANFHKEARRVYQQRLDLGVAREQARKDLPLSNYTEAYWKIDLKNLMGFLGLRMDSHAQKEIRDYATVIGEEIMAKWLPITWSAFNDYHTMRNAMSLTAREIRLINALPRNLPGVPNIEIPNLLKEFGWYEKSKKTGKLKRNRERSECEEKLAKLGFSIPWRE